MGMVGDVLQKAMSPGFYQQTFHETRTAMYNYYHPLMRQGSVKPFVHMMFFTSVVMYSTSYMARDYERLKQKHINQEKAVKEYNEKHGIHDDH